MTEPSASTCGAAAAASASASDDSESASVLPSNKTTTTPPRPPRPNPDSTVDNKDGTVDARRSSSSSPLPSSSHDNNGPPQTSKSPLRPPPIITDSLPAPTTAQHDAALSSPDSPLSALSTPPESPTDDFFQSLTSAAPNTNGQTNGQLGNGLTNGHARDTETPEDDRPAKRRRVRDSTPPPPGSKTRKVFESPPWKKFEADGPTTIIEGGKRKSGRLNTVPLEQMSSDKRITRKSYSQNSPPSKLRQGSANGHAAASQSARQRATLTTPCATKSVPTRTTPRIKLRVNRVPLTELPLVHPDRAKKKRVASNIDEYFRDAYNIPVTDGGQLIPEDEPVLTDDMALAEAKTIIRIEDEARPDGLLGNSCVIFEPEAAEEPPRQYAHVDHLVKAAQNLRKWMVREQKEHRDKAKKLAEACQAVWRSRQPKSNEEIEREARDMWIGRYRTVVKAMFGTWENVRLEVNRRRMEEWEAEEQRRVKAALQEAVSRSEQQLLARQAQFDSDMSDEDLDEDGEPLGSDSDDSQISGDDEGSVDGPSDEDNMSSSEEDDDRKSAASDEGLTQEQLREKYANLPDIESKIDNNDGGDTSMAEALNDDTSDESVDMDDDMGSSDDSSNESGSDDDDDGDDSGDEEGRPSGLLGLFFGEKELKKLQEDTADSAAEPGDAPMTDADAAAPSPEGQCRHCNFFRAYERPARSKQEQIRFSSSHCSTDRGAFPPAWHAPRMGLGKTIQTIALLAHLACTHEVWGPHLVIVPTSVMLNWEMEFKKWCPGFKILTYYGNQDERKRKRQGWTNDDFWNVCITSYQIVLQDAQVFRRRRWHYMILDEAHNIKNFRSQRWQTLLGFNTHSRLLLTGTPLQNNLTELWSLLFFLMPSENGVGGFADLKEFHDWFARPESQILEHGREQMDEEARAIISKLHKVLRPYLLRRLKADVEKQMPAKIEHVEFCRLSKRQRELYDGFLARSETRDTLSSGNYLSIINCLMQLRKVCNHPDLFVDRPIMTSFRMEKSVAADYEVTEQLLRKKLLAPKPMTSVNLGFLNLVPTQHEDLSNTVAERVNQLSSNRVLLDLRETQRIRGQASHHTLDPSTVKSTIGFLDSAARWGRFEELQHCVYLNALRRQQRPIYGKRLREFLTIGADKRPYRPRPRVPKLVMSWFEEDSFILRTMIPTLDQRAASMERTISKFACVTPAVVTRDMEPFLLGWKGVQAFGDADLRLSAPVRRLPFIPPERPIDPWHESRMRLSIQFPDKRLLQYDCGKLQALDKLLRKLQAGGHRALIFTQMTKVLDILEQFLNIHGHKYLRLDGSTKVEQRQILCDRFNVDDRILCFILSTRSGGLGLNLTGADTVIFYDQDWNPAMDKQCQDRCHRIGQTRDVHIYRLVSEHTIEANILRKASQKQMLDDVVIQEGAFTTDYFNNRHGELSVQEVAGGLMGEHDAAANAAMDLVLGGVDKSDTRTATKALEQAEDTEDVVAARAAEREILQDDADFSETKPGSGAASTQQGTPREGSLAPGRSGLGLFVEAAETPAAEEAEPEYNAFGDKIHNIDEYMVASMTKQLEGTTLDLPKDKKKGKKKGRDTRRR
ncbi:hypothetical protein KVR01_013337 [Diaporthe batatas]|uniref:chromatin-remodeling protein SWR1 n=1 Tax=Diaporthe batatas TaxID=748121 RepID=UPI001D03A7C6|nr:chromatin-remodeling protein SWR1 [Diaporthe batatas]KAG8156732.1 hypothetical protein KVR01_013337 [Diaporthe batatas]